MRFPVGTQKQLSSLTVTCSDLSVSFQSFQQMLLILRGIKLWLFCKKKSVGFFSAKLKEVSWSVPLMHILKCLWGTSASFVKGYLDLSHEKCEWSNEHLCREVHWERGFVCESKWHSQFLQSLCLRAFSIFEGTSKFLGLDTEGPSPLMLLKETLSFCDWILFRSKSETIRDFVAEGLF